MDLFLAISQGIGSSLATGMRALLVPLFVGVMARANVGIDFEHTGFEWLEAIWWLVLLVVLVVAAWLLDRSDVEIPEAVWVVVAMGLGGMLFAGALEDENYFGTSGHRARHDLRAARFPGGARVPRRRGGTARCARRERRHDHRAGRLRAHSRSRHSRSCCRPRRMSQSRSASGCCSPAAAAQDRSTKASESCVDRELVPSQTVDLLTDRPLLRS